MPEFVEFAGKKEYKCPRCKAIIRYAKFFGDDKKILTTDGKEPYFDKDKKPMSNTGWPTDPNTKQMHECSPKQFPESELKINNTLDSGWGDNKGTTADDSITLVNDLQTPKPKEFPYDELITKKQIEKDNDLLPLIWARYLNVKKFVLSKNETNPALFGLVFKILTREDKDE